MRENMDSNLQNEWEKKLVEKGELSTAEIEKGSREKMPISALQGFSVNVDDRTGDERTKILLEQYNGLDPKIQKDIVTDIRDKRDIGYTLQEILDRLHILAEHDYKLMELTSKDSDKVYEQKKSRNGQVSVQPKRNIRQL